jgi:hypothetical protein
MSLGKEPRADALSPAGLVLDTCVWLDLAGNHQNELLLAALEMLCGEHQRAERGPATASSRHRESFFAR